MCCTILWAHISSENLWLTLPAGSSSVSKFSSLRSNLRWYNPVIKRINMTIKKKNAGVQLAFPLLCVYHDFSLVLYFRTIRIQYMLVFQEGI